MCTRWPKPFPKATPSRWVEAVLCQFLDATGQLWAQGALIGKVGSVFTCTAAQHGGQESTILSFHISLPHHGFVIVGLPYAFQGQLRLDEN
jgi:NAD(P)H dehydrogenase (quinone)